MKKGSVLASIIILAAFTAFFIKANTSLDPDFGWHLRIGELILRSGIPPTDPFSYTMPSFPFVDHEWLTNVVFYKLYPIFGMGFLAFVFALLTLLSLLIAIRFSFHKWSTIAFVLASGILISFVGVRPQVLTWVLFAILLQVLFSKPLWQRFKFFVPLLFVLWANIHGGFSAGIAAFGIILVAEIVEKRTIAWDKIAVFVLSVLATLVNPYGIRIWEEVFRQLSDSHLRFSIQEWMPAVFYPDMTLWVFIPFSLMLVWRGRRNFSISQAVLYAGLLLAGISSIRHIPLWILVALPITIQACRIFEREAAIHKEGTVRLKKALGVFWLIIALIVCVHLWVSFVSAALFSESRFYPKAATFYLRQHAQKGEIFSWYGWGGYLIWKMPEKKVFIDGRMPSWRGYNLPSTESDYAFREYGEILHSKKRFLQAVLKYNIDTILLPIEKSTPKQDFPLQKEFDDVLLRLGKKNQSESSFYQIVKESGWNKVYQDSVSVIYRKR